MKAPLCRFSVGKYLHKQTQSWYYKISRRAYRTSSTEGSAKFLVEVGCRYETSGGWRVAPNERMESYQQRP